MRFALYLMALDLASFFSLHIDRLVNRACLRINCKVAPLWPVCKLYRLVEALVMVAPPPPTNKPNLFIIIQGDLQHPVNPSAGGRGE